MPTPFIESSLVEEDREYETPLRPQCLGDFQGQEAICERLQIMIGAAKKRGEALGHCLFSGPPGLGKTTLANILAKEMASDIVITSGPAIEKPGDLAGVLTSLKTGDVLFIDELHRMSRVVEEYLYSAMEDYRLDLMIDSGPNARTVQVQLNTFTLVGATTRLGLLTAPLRSRFGFSCRLDYYKPRILQGILMRSAKLLGASLDERAALEIGMRSRGTPRIANNLLRWVRDFAQMRNNNVIDKESVTAALKMLNIDELGLDELDRRILEILIDNYNGGPAGINTLAVAVQEEPSTLEEVHEPFLIMLGLIKRTPRGREATAQAYKHLKRIKQGEFL